MTSTRPGGTAVAAAPGAAKQRILVIKLGAFGDFIQAFGPFQAIRRHHPAAHITLLTTSPYRGLAEASPWFDEVWLDRRPPVWRADRWLALRRRMAAADFARVYDLQTSDRTGWYFRLLGPRRPEWSGIAAGCSHPHANPLRDRMHTVDRQAEQLGMAGIADVAPPETGWLDAPLPAETPDGPFILLIPGGAAHRPAKRWPAANFAVLAGVLTAIGFRPVLVGATADRAAIAVIVAACPDAVDVSERTSLLQLGGLARRAVAAVGNDTGPMHLIAAMGCHAAVLFSEASDPALCAPRGGNVTVLRRAPLSALPVAEVEAALRLR